MGSSGLVDMLATLAEMTNGMEVVVCVVVRRGLVDKLATLAEMSAIMVMVMVLVRHEVLGEWHGMVDCLATLVMVCMVSQAGKSG